MQRYRSCCRSSRCLEVVKDYIADSLAYCARQSIGKSTGVMENYSHGQFVRSAVGRQIEEALRGDFDAKTIERSVSDALNNKSVATLRARASSILSFARWKKGLVPDARIFPITEHEAYMYVTELRSTMHQERGPRGFWKRCHLHFTCLELMLVMLSSHRG